MQVSQQIKKLRLQHQFSQDDVADRIHVSRQTISNWENDHNYPDIQSLLLMADLYHVKLDDLVRGDLDEIQTKKLQRMVLKDTILRFSILIVYFIAMFLTRNNLTLYFWSWLIGLALTIATIYFGSKRQRQMGLKLQTYHDIVYYLKTGQLLDSQFAKRRTIMELGIAILIGTAFAAISIIN
ncbi:helix-turn-helix domain-containing protein [Pediococcus argentinicus]|uniref:HTH cro/C1-type domain-containing protein n=1 Tax=Pediococcus argentinicus TaxID=480391 RepID=A0A0R2N9E2_9LACO|nr:helix-turn-helix transcriptional regulator [Pediococcus argentinicus]KRO22471.1 hypothetical protein IV88_GL001153 [Pediococcus argentinicus]NKZ23055.1 helix-turn-helix transcriptional regulator [Pediococcus argentinicus]GEP20139.1 transcriptional regulator [Pediococcus argentinicus]